MQHTLSTYRSIIPDEQAQWNQLGDVDILVRLHRKFWGVNMQDEEKIWRATQPEHNFMAVNTDETTEEDEQDETAEEDEQDEIAEEDEDDETGDGCYILTLGIPGLGHSSIWIRKEYIRLYNFCEGCLESWKDGKMTPSVIVTGQPGIGKSYWITYALRRCLADKKPVMWYRDRALFLFVEDGVYQSPTYFRSTALKKPVWTLVDSDESRTGVPPNLAVHDTKHFIIFSSSPQVDRWKPLEKTTEISICIMNPWSKKEISKAAVIHGLENDERIYSMYDDYGPTPRICFNMVLNDNRFTSFKDRLTGAIQALSGATLRTMVTELNDYTMGTISNTILLLKRMPKKLGDNDETSWARKSVEPITHAVERAFQVQLWRRTQAERLELYLYLANVEATRSIAGIFFESLAQSKLQNGIELVLVPMEKKASGGSGRGKRLPRWHSNHGDGANSSSVRHINVAPTKTIEYQNVDQIEDEVYYVPKSKNQGAFDSFIVANRELFIFQFSIGSNHPINKGIIPFFTQASLPPRANWHFVFVVPTVPISEICCPQTRDPGLKRLVDEMDLSSAVLDPA